MSVSGWYQIPDDSDEIPDFGDTFLLPSEQWQAGETLILPPGLLSELILLSNVLSTCEIFHDDLLSSNKII